MRKMSTDLNNLNENLYILPPFVNGKLHGFCELFIDDIKWTTTKTYSLVKIAITFWGDKKARIFNKVEITNFDRTKKLKPSKGGSNSLITITYKVCTNHRLFQSYLKNCEPIVVEIFSSKTLDLIGKSFIEIPQGLYNLEQNSYSRETVTSSIINNRNFKLGDIKISFEVKLNINCCTTMFAKAPPVISMKTSSERDLPGMRNQKSIKKNTLSRLENKENLQVVGKTKTILSREANVKKQFLMKTTTSVRKQSSINHKNTESSKSTASSISGKESNLTNDNYLKSNSSVRIGKSSLINYLTGQQISQTDESRIFSDLMQLSPSQSLIDDININCAKTQVRVQQKCLNVFVNVLELNAEGYEHVKNYVGSFSDVKFIFKCVVTSKLFNLRENMNFVSSSLEFPSHRVIFGRELKRNIKLSTGTNSSYLNFGFCMKTVGYSSSHLIGFSRIKLDEILKNKSRFFKKCSVFNESDVRVGSVTLKIDMSDEDAQDQLESIHNLRPTSKQIIPQQRVKITSHPSTSNDDCENHVGERNFEHKNMQTDENEVRIKNSLRKDNNEDNADMVDVEIKNGNKKNRVYEGILFVEVLRSIKNQQNSAEYFITYDGFWNECQELTGLSVGHVFNYLKQFAVIFDCEFLKKVQNNHMELKLWEKTNENAEKLIASTKVPLHQFYIAFKDVEMIEHLSTNKLPVISTDTWCNFISPLSNELFCQAKILLAIGNENQIDFIKLSRNLHNLQPPQRQVATEPETPKNSTSSCDANAQMKNKLSAFIDSLSQKLPEPCGTAVKQQKFSASSNSSFEQPQLRKTSDLLDTLQKALSQPPSTDSCSLFQQQPAQTSHSEMSISHDSIKMLVIIEHAANLPKVVVKKCRNNKRKNKGTPPNRSEFEPHVYATFEAIIDDFSENSLPEDTIKSHEGIVYCTNIVKGTNPEWNKSIQVQLPFDVIKNPQKKFVIKVWRKTSHDPVNVEAKPFDDSVIGFSAIDLSVLLTGLPVLSGYYSIVDFSGRSNGQIKVTIKPLEDVNKFRNPASPLVPLMQPLNIDVISSSESSNDGSTLLSRTLKRKFTELDEITQRLKARLFDVTGDENFDPDEEFERDLNTAVADEMEELNDSKGDFGWLMKEDENLLKKEVDSRPSTSKEQPSIPTQREITGCSSETSQLAIDDLLKKYDLDTLINPLLFKNILDPTLANSDSTPTLNPLKDNGDESDVTTVSSIISNDQVQLIQKALQRTSLHEEDQNSPRREPDGT